jgi:hypothetical protein
MAPIAKKQSFFGDAKVLKKIIACNYSSKQAQKIVYSKIVFYAGAAVFFPLSGEIYFPFIKKNVTFAKTKSKDDCRATDCF